MVSKRRVNPELGQSLLEVLVALAAIFVILGAITGIVITSLKQSGASNDLSEASQLASNGMELARGQVNLQAGRVYCVDDEGTFTYTPSGTCSVNVDVYIRKVTVATTTQCGTLRQVTVSVAWQDASCTQNAYCREIPLTSCI